MRLDKLNDFFPNNKLDKGEEVRRRKALAEIEELKQAVEYLISWEVLQAIDKDGMFLKILDKELNYYRKLNDAAKGDVMLINQSRIALIKSYQKLLTDASRLKVKKNKELLEKREKFNIK